MTDVRNTGLRVFRRKTFFEYRVWGWRVSFEFSLVSRAGLEMLAGKEGHC